MARGSDLNAKIMAYVRDRDKKTSKLLGKLWPGKQ
jgi:hypothetical protein